MFRKLALTILTTLAFGAIPALAAELTVRVQDVNCAAPSMVSYPDIFVKVVPDNGDPPQSVELNSFGEAVFDDIDLQFEDIIEVRLPEGYGGPVMGCGSIWSFDYEVVYESSGGVDLGVITFDHRPSGPCSSENMPGLCSVVIDGMTITYLVDY